MKFNKGIALIINTSILLLIGINLVTSTPCISELGCSKRIKLLSWLSPLRKDFTTDEKLAEPSFKMVYIQEDYITFSTSSDPSKSLMEDEETETYQQQGQRIERQIPFCQVMLDCGKYHDSLCQIRDYPRKKKIKKILDKVAEKMHENMDVNCLVIPFYENAYAKPHHKIAIVCLNHITALYTIQGLLLELSRMINRKHLGAALSRTHSIRGIYNPKHRLSTFIDKTVTPVLSQTKSAYINMAQDLKGDKTKVAKHVAKYELREQRTVGAFCFIVSHALAKKRIDLESWKRGLNPVPNPDCCVLCKGTKRDLLICAGTTDPDMPLENDMEKCRPLIAPVMKEIGEFISKIKLGFAYTNLEIDPKKQEDCRDPNWNIIRNRMRVEAKAQIELCRQLFVYVNDETRKKKELCMKNYVDSLKFAQNDVTWENPDLVTPFENCVKAKLPNIYDTRNIEQKIQDFANSKVSFLEKSSSHMTEAEKWMHELEEDDLDHTEYNEDHEDHDDHDL